MRKTGVLSFDNSKKEKMGWDWLILGFSMDAV
jgi:hypothetical protein